MLLKDVIRTKICEIRQSSDASLKPFIRWAGMIEKPLLITLLDEVQIELDEEEHHFREIAELVGSGTLLHQQLRQDWCLHCAQLRAYYRRRNKSMER